MPRILAVALTASWAAVPAWCADIQLQRPSTVEIEIAGGTGSQAWKIRYGTLSPNYEARLESIGSNRAWFSHGGWLRLIDTQRGVVTGRWHFPGQIIRLVPEGNKVEVTVEERLGVEHAYHRTQTFDPEAPVIAFWPDSWAMLYRLSFTEASPYSVAAAPGGHFASAEKAPPETQKVIPQLEEAVRRDSFSPWLGIHLGKLLRDVGDRRAKAVLQQAVQVPTTDFTELFRISAFLDNLGETELGRAAFERGYQDFIERGNEPRLFLSVWGRTMLGAVPTTGRLPAPEQRGELIERIYRLQPHGEAARLAWRLYADHLQKNGQMEQAQLWRARAEEAGVGFLGLTRVADGFILVVWACVLAGLIQIVLLLFRYRPQRVLEAAARQRGGRITHGFSYFNFAYWDRRERITFLSSVLAFWYAVGVIGSFVAGILLAFEAPGFSMGNFGSPATVSWLERRRVWSPEWDLLLAVAYQQDGQKQRAEQLYRGLPQFAESWNNLGVILKEAGKEQEARQAFEQALQLDPGLAEAALNLGRPPQSLWTEQHRKYLPGRPMIAPPSQERIRNAMLGGPPLRVYVRALWMGFRNFSEVGKLAG